jgi:putative transposase
MKSYSVDLRSKIVEAHLIQKISIRKVAQIFAVSKSLLPKIVKQKRTERNVFPKNRGKPRFIQLISSEETVRSLIAEYPDATLA